MNGGIGIIEMLKRTNILALVGGGRNPKFPTNQLIIWDDHQGKIISKLRINENIMSVRLRNDKIIVISRNKFYLFNINTLVTITILNTFDNPLGIIALSNGDNNKLIAAFPYEAQGSIFIGDFFQKCEKISVLHAHDSRVVCISINKEGTLMASSSDKGTLIRIYIINDDQKFWEFRRGTKSVEMNCITFDPNNKFIGCSSNVGTIHIFSITSIVKELDEKNKTKKDENDDEPKNSKSLLGKIGGLFNIKNAYLESERSFAKFKIQEENSLIGFGNDNTFVVITMDGKYYKVAYDPKRGGECFKLEEKNIFKDV